MNEPVILEELLNSTERFAACCVMTDWLQCSAYKTWEHGFDPCLSQLLCRL